MDKVSRLFLDHVEQLQKQLEHLLEREPLQHSKPAPPRAPFEVTTDLSQIDLLGVGLPFDPNQRTFALFSKLCPYFESGLLFFKGPVHTPLSKTLSNDWSAVAGFDHGVFFHLKENQINLPFRFPEMSLIEVRKVHSPDIFSQLEKIKVIKTPQTQALIFKPLPQFIFMVTSHLADPWLKIHIEKIQKEILMLLVDSF